MQECFNNQHEGKILEENFGVLKRKIENNLNQAPIDGAMKEFFCENDLKIGKLEQEALKNRHRFSHGGLPQNYEKIIIFKIIIQSNLNGHS